LAISSRHLCRQCQASYNEEISNILELKFSQNRPTSSVLSGFGTIKLLSIRMSEALSEGKFLSFGRDTSSRNSHSFEEDFTDHFAGRVQELDGQIGLGRHT
jgi:hypothetical protein